MSENLIPSFPFPGYRVLQFAKAPELGKVKTRMKPVLCDDACIELHCALTRKVFDTLHKAQLCPQELWVSAFPDHPFFSQLVEGSGAPVHTQVDGNLGVKMALACKSVLDRADVEGVIIVGSDCPFIDANYLREALVSLSQGQDAVIGPATDGGYVLIGLSKYHQAVFENINWGSDLVAQQTIAAMGSLQWRYQLLAPQFDIDRPDDLALLEGVVEY